MDIILASKSPRRRELIKQITDTVDFVSVDTDESLPKDNMSPSEAAMFLAEKKAVECDSKLDIKDKNTVIIGCDTIVTLNNKIYGKPADETEAKKMLRELSGNTHSVITGICLLIPGEEPKTCYEETKVSFNNLSEKMIQDYIDTGDPFDKAGAYGIQNLTEDYINSVDGDYDNVVGLPVKFLRENLLSLEEK